MRVIKPYGRSRIKNETKQGPRRILCLNPDFSESRKVPDFAKSHDALVIAQWISTIDKIISKPIGNKKPTKEQRALRDKVGKACWTFICDNNLLKGNLPDGIKADVLWNSKIHPYPKEDKTYHNNPPRIEGRWFDVFIGKGNGNNFDANEVAQKIHEHLYKNAYSFEPDRPRKGTGAITHRADSIEQNVLKLEEERGQWIVDKVKYYKNKGDIADIIYQGIEAEKTKGAGKHFGIAMDALRAQYAHVFGNVSIPDAKKQEGLFALHEAVKAYYKGLLKRHKKGQDILKILPKNNDELIELIEKKQENRELNHLIRLGKIIHYQAGRNQADAADTTAAVISHWPNEAEVENSYYWGSDGQAEIKRNEAFVRIWRHVLSLMQRTATDWADPENKQGKDILDSKIIEAVTGVNFRRDAFNKKFKLLFGSRADIILPLNTENDDSRKAILWAALKGLSSLRNGSFHFKGLGNFSYALQTLNPSVLGKRVVEENSKKPADKRLFVPPSSELDQGRDAMARLWNQDVSGRRQRLIDTLRAADVEHFLKECQAEKLIDSLAADTTPLLALPRFNRIIKRANDTSPKTLPKPVNRKIMEESPALRCQYICLKLLYERSFREHLDKYTNNPKADELKIYYITNFNKYINEAAGRATDAAININGGRKDNPERDLIIAKVEKYGGLTKDDKSLNDFFFRLSALTASDFGVQQGYESDSKKAKTQANTIEAFKCEILALAFADWLSAEFSFLKYITKKLQKRTTPLHNLNKLAENLSPPDTDAKTWQHSLYFLLHLAPVDAVSKLLHQMRKWQVLAKDAPGRDNYEDAKPIAEVLSLYLDMHDAKFEGGGTALSVDSDQAQSNVPEDFRKLFENPDDFDHIFPPAKDKSKYDGPGKPEDDRRIPIRGLREILRFGHMKPLQQIYEAYKVRTDDVRQLETFEKPESNGKSQITKAQEEREDLHKKLVRKNSKNPNKVKDYREALQQVTEHRHLSAHIYLVNHVRLHWLMMAVLGRLVDYAGLLERDLYFTMLAMIYQRGALASDAFEEDGIEYLKNGQILFAFNKKADNYTDLFGSIKDKDKFNLNAAKNLRNIFAHFNMLRGDKQPDLTQMVNDARIMMAYDRKLKNAVSKSIKDLLAREGLTIEWTMNESHILECATVVTAEANHLGGTKSGGEKITEALHGEQYVSMVKTLFNGGTDAP